MSRNTPIGKDPAAPGESGQGMRIYLVGGAVRDEILGFFPPDKDYAVLGATEESFLRAHPGAKKVGRPGCCVFIHRGREFTLSDQPDIWADLARRDLTINAAAKDERGTILATERTRRDLENRVLRPVHPDNFRDDPLRCYRAARMAACLPDFTLHRELEAILHDMARSPTLDHLAAERVCGETRKACGCPAPGRFLRIIAEYGLFAFWFRELAPSENGARSAVATTAERMDRLRGDALCVWMGLCSILDTLVPSHASEGWNPEAARLAGNMSRRLRMPLAFSRAGERAAGWIRAASRYARLPPESRVDLLTDLKDRELNERMLAVAASVSAEAAPETWREDLRRMAEVRLPPDKRGLGPESGRILRRMRRESLCRE